MGAGHVHAHGRRRAADLLRPPLLSGPGVEYDPDRDRYWFNTENAAEKGGYLSGGERRVLDIAASLANDDRPVALGDAVSGIDRKHLDLVLAGEESFDLTVCSLAWLEDQVRRDGLLDGRHHVIVEFYNWQVLREFIERRVWRCEGPSWPDVAEKLARLGHWEFEDYPGGA